MELHQRKVAGLVLNEKLSCFSLSEKNWCPQNQLAFHPVLVMQPGTKGALLEG